MFRRRPRPRVLPLGVISEATLRPEDLIPAYLAVLESIRLTRADRHSVQVIRRASLQEGYYNGQALTDGDDHGGEYVETDPAGDLDDLQTIAGNYCPAYAYVGSTEGDGACVGVWPDMDAVRADCVEHRKYLDPKDPRARDLQVTTIEDTNELKDVYSPYALHVNGHGNCTLYRKAGRTWREVWAVV